MTGLSHASLPCSTRMPSATAVNTLVLDAMPNCVRASTFSGLPSVFTP